jgi:hypothetical protein
MVEWHTMAKDVTSAAIAPLGLDFRSPTGVLTRRDWGKNMKDVDTHRIAAHRRNISRYKRLLCTHLTGLERKFVDRRLEEERSALAQLLGDLRHEGQPAARTSGSASDPSICSVTCSM